MGETRVLVKVTMAKRGFIGYAWTYMTVRDAATPTRRASEDPRLRVGLV